jgi:hypothetical protein
MMFLFLGIDYLLKLQDPEVSAKTEAGGNVFGNNSCRKYEYDKQRVASIDMVSMLSVSKFKIIQIIQEGPYIC